jgi:hypothetical protein
MSRVLRSGRESRRRSKDLEMAATRAQSGALEADSWQGTTQLPGLFTRAGYSMDRKRVYTINIFTLGFLQSAAPQRSLSHTLLLHR